MKKQMFETNYNLNKERRLSNYHCPSDSQTVPEQALSLKELLSKYTHGIAPSVSQMGSYDNDGDDFDDINPLRVPGVDIVDIHELSAEISQRISKAEEFVKTEAEKKRFAALKAEWEASVQRTQENAGERKE